MASHILMVSLSLAVVVAEPARRLWGGDGHMIVGQVAWSMLSSEEQTWAKGILGGETLAEVATWADKVKYSQAYHWSRALHFINAPDGKCTFEWSRDCQTDGVADWCAAGAIINYTQRLVSPPLVAITEDACAGLHKADCQKNNQCAWQWTGSWKHSCKSASGPAPSPGPSPGPGPAPSPQPFGPLSVQGEALRFLTHFMGDIHQPLHSGWTTDLGGNTIHVEEGFDDDKKMNLHAVWDEGIIEEVEKDQGYQWEGYAASLVQKVHGDWASEVKDWVSCLSSSSPDLKECLTQMAQEDLTLDCKSAYFDDKGNRITNQDQLDQDYYTTRAKVINQRLAQGGVRLAALLKYIKGANLKAQTTIHV